MTIEAELPDGRVLEFPDGTDPQVVQATVRRVLGVQMTPAPEPSVIDRVAGVIEPIATFATGALAEPAAGVAGLATTALTGDPAAGAAVVEGVQERLTFNPRTSEGQKNLQSIAGSDVVQAIGGALESVEGKLGDLGFDVAGPIGGAIGEAVPTAIMEVLGLAAPAAAGKGARRVGAQAERTGRRLMDEVAELRAPVPEQGMKRVADAVSKASPDEVAALVQADPNFYRAVDELNISTEPLASFASQNPQFRAVEQGLASIPGSQLDAQSKQFISSLSQRADELIQEYGGTLDKAELSDRFRQDSLSTIDSLFEQADGLYDQLNARIPAKTRVEAPNTVDFIRAKASELGGRKELPPLLNKVLRQLETKETAKTTRTASPITGAGVETDIVRKLPTHERLNQTRKEVGQALSRGTGPFKDQETGLLKALYARLKQDQDAVAVDLGAADVSDAANNIVQQRKIVEDNLAKLLGRDLQGSILPRVGADLKKLAKGDIQRWDETMSRIPPTSRQEIVVSSLNDIFSGANVGGQSLNVTQFTKFMDQLDRSPTVKNRVYKELPKESIRAIENLRTVSKGVSQALGDKITTGRVSAFFDENDGILRRLMGQGLTMAVAAKAGPLAGMAAGEFINQASGGAKAASAVLATPQFQSMLKAAVRDGVTEGAEITDRVRKAEKAFERSAQFKRWADTLPESDAARLASLGTVSYLTASTKEEDR